MHQRNERRDRHEWIYGLDEDMQRIIGAADNVIGHQELDAHPAYIELDLREQALEVGKLASLVEDADAVPFRTVRSHLDGAAGRFCDSFLARFYYCRRPFY